MAKYAKKIKKKKKALPAFPAWTHVSALALRDKLHPWVVPLTFYSGAICFCFVLFL